MAMSERVGAGSYTLAELARALGVDETEAAEILVEHGYGAPSGSELLTLSADDYLDLMTAAPDDRDPDGR
jgi:hypothetical protein